MLTRALGLMVVLVALLAAPARADGPPQLVKDLRPGPDHSAPHDLIAFQGALYFTAADEGGLGLWRSDGTDITLVKRIDGGAGFAVMDGTLYLPLLDGLWRTEGASPTLVRNVRGSGLTVVGAALYFVVDGRELWRSDGTFAGTTLVRSFGVQSLRSLTAVGTRLFFVADGQLWRADGTTTVALGTSAPAMLTPFGAQLVFAANGTELWRSDGTSVTLIEDGLPNLGYAAPLGDRLYFAAAGGLWRTDGTSAEPIPGVPEPRYLTPVGGRLLFAAGGQLWRTDGTSTTTVHPVDPAPSGDGARDRFTVASGSAFFQAVDAATGNELWRSDGTTAARVADINPGPASSQPEDMTVAGPRLFFSATRAGTGTELWSMVLGPTADLAVTLSAAGTTLTATVRNLGPERTTGVRVLVGEEEWVVGALEPDEAKPLVRTVPGDVEVTARVVGSDLPDPFPANDAMTIVMGSAIRVTGACTLVSAIVAANTDAPAGGCPGGNGADTIRLSAGSVHTLTAAYETGADGDTALPSITSDITIAGHGGVIRRAGAAARLFRVAPSGVLTLREVTVRGGSGSPSGGNLLVRGRLVLEDARVESGIARDGGGIASLSGEVTLTRAVVTDNTAANGGGIYAAGGSLTLTDTTVTANRASHPTILPFGGGIYANAALAITRGAITANTAHDGGGLVHLATGTLTEVTVAGNAASFFGGLDNRGTLTVLRSTVTDAISSGFSGVAALRLVESTVSGAPVESDSGTLSVESSTVIGGVLRNATVTGSVAPQCAGMIADGGGNTGCGVDPELGPLADNGGPTRTHAPLPGSPAIDRGSGCDVVDQRGVARPLDGDGDGAARCDAGAVEAPAVAAIAKPGPGPGPIVAPPMKPVVTGLKSRLKASGTTVTLATAKNPPVASTTQTLTARSGAKAVLARGTTRIPAGRQRRLTVKLTPAGRRALRRTAIRVRLRIVATAPDGTKATITRTVRLSGTRSRPSR